MALQRLKEAAENAKHELSSSEIANIKLPFISADASGPKHLDKEITRQLLKELTRDLLEKLVAPCKNCLKDSGVSKIDEVILVGGMTRMPAVQEKVKEIFGKMPNKSVNPDEAVALGAAIQGSVLAGDIEDIIMLDVAPLSLGIEIEGGMMHPIIRRNTTIPTSASETFSTATDNQPSVFIRVYQGERAKASDNKLLGNFELTGIDPAPRGVPQIEVKFDIDANGIVKVSAKDKKTNKEANITIKDSGGVSKEEIERMIKEAEENRAKDEELKDNLKTLNQAQTYCYTFEKQIEEFKSHKNFKEDDPQFQEFKRLYEDLKKLTEEKNYPELKNQLNKIDELMKLSNELMQKMPKEEKKDDEGYASGEEEDILDVDPKKKDDDKNDPEKRRNYDQYGSESSFGQSASAGGFGQGESIFKDIFDTFFGRGTEYSGQENYFENRTKTQAGSDVLINLSLTFKESVLGVRKKVSIDLEKACNVCRQTGAATPSDIINCSTCRGRGVVNTIQRTILGAIRNQVTCSQCQGSGQKIRKKCGYCGGKKFTKQKEIVELSIPRGIQPDKRLRYQGVGNDGWHGGVKGDIYVNIKVKDNPYFQHKGNDIHVNLPISFLDAILGGNLKVITLEGIEKIEIIPGTQNGDRLILCGRGCYLGINKGLFNQVTRIIEEIEVMNNKLNSVDFAEEEEILQEERDAVIQKYSGLVEDLRKEKEIITRQIENEDDTVAVAPPLQQKSPKKGYCYFCDTKITSSIPYQFSKEEQEVLEVKIVEGAGFCSQECLLSHCKEYKKWQTIGNLRNRINNLIKKEKELELDIDALPAEKKAGFFRRIAQNLGLAKKESSPTVFIGFKD
ncbi:17152_t:CDS:2 [Funneliformis geosporum]|nr:17152_t:CDS:2 [Funneliformis geosporum]